jgi:flagellar protein FlgJ
VTSDPIFGPGFGGLSERERLARTARELEAVVVAQIFSTMRETVPDSGLFEKSAADDIFRSMLDEQLAREVSERSPFGLAEAVEKELARKLSADAAAAPDSAGRPAADATRTPPRSRWRA